MCQAIKRAERQEAGRAGYSQPALPAWLEQIRMQQTSRGKPVTKTMAETSSDCRGGGGPCRFSVRPVGERFHGKRRALQRHGHPVAGVRRRLCETVSEADPVGAGRLDLKVQPGDRAE